MQDPRSLDRRRFLKTTAAGIGAAGTAASILRAAEGEAAKPPQKTEPKDMIWRSKEPTMDYRRIGRTNYMVSRIVAGIGGDNNIWRRMLAKGMNYWDTARGYKGGNHETELSDFFRKYRDKLWITSKSTDVAGYAKIDEEVVKLYRAAMKPYLGESEGDLLALHKKAVEKQKKTGEKPDLRPAGKRMAELYSRKLDESLGKMKVDHVDCYMMHGIEIPWFFDCLEVWEAYEKAHQAGKARHFGFSVHKHHKEVLAAGVEANQRGPWKIDLIMPGVNPVSLDEVKPELAAFKKQDVGIIAMKTTGVKNQPIEGAPKERLAKLGDITKYNEWEQKKLYMLHLTDGLIDGCIAAMENNEQMEKDLALPMVKLSASAQRELKAIVKLQMAGACHLCGSCETNCPENIAVTDMIRYHAYIHQYNDKELARQLYSMAGYDPAKLCSNCGTCAEVCPSDVPITRYLHELSRDLA